MAAVASCKYTYKIDPAIFKNFPGARVGVGLAQIPIVKKSSDKAIEVFLSSLKQQVVQGFKTKGITSQNYLQTPACESWAKVFKTYQVNEDKQCTLNHLFRRVAGEADKLKEAEANGKKRNADIPRISTAVDLCNCVSVETHTPMGVLDIRNIEPGMITLRYGKEGETFTAIGEMNAQAVKTSHVVLSDNKGILAYLWTHKVSERACVKTPEQPEKRYVLVCTDQAEKGAGDAEEALNLFFKYLPALGGNGTIFGVADQEHPEIEFAVPKD